MDTVTEVANRRRIGRWVVIGVATAAALALLLTLHQVNRSPRTDDASVWANYIEVAPQVTGWLVELPIKDNAFVKQGDLLFVIDPRPYEYALQQALSDQKELEEQIIDERRRIAAQNSAVLAAGPRSRPRGPASRPQEAILMPPTRPSAAPRLLLLPPQRNSCWTPTTCIVSSRCSRSSTSPWSRWTMPIPPCASRRVVPTRQDRKSVV